MAKSLDDELTDLRQYEQLSDDERIRRIRKLESENRKLKADAKHADEKRRQAEDELSAAELRADAMLAMQGERSPKVLAPKKSKPGGSATAIICATDWHYEETVDPETVNGLNEYNPEIARKRIRQVWQKSLTLLEMHRKMSNVQQLLLWLGGDLITGYIHEELVESNAMSPSEACLEVQDEIHSGIALLRKESGVRNLDVVTNNGNHGRTTPKSRISTAYKNSYEWLAYQNMAKYYQREKDVRWNVSKGYHNIVDVQGHPVRFHHGDGLRYQGGVGGITIPVNKAIDAWNRKRPVALDVFGHWHQFMHDWRFVSVGCVIGYGPFALQIKAAYQPPTQAFIVVDSKRGKVAAEAIFCD